MKFLVEARTLNYEKNVTLPFKSRRGLAANSMKDLVKYRGEQNPWVKGSVCFVQEFALPPFSPLCGGSFKTKQALNL